MEYNIYFHRNGINAAQFIAKLGLSENHIYVGNVNPTFDTEKLVSSYQNSKSWKITQPLREIHELLIGAKKFINPRKYSRR